MKLDIHDDKAVLTAEDGKTATLPFIAIDATNHGLINRLLENEEVIKEILSQAIKDTEQKASFLDGIWIQSTNYNILIDILVRMFEDIKNLSDRHIEEGKHSVQRQKDQFKNIMNLSRALVEREEK